MEKKIYSTVNSNFLDKISKSKRYDIALIVKNEMRKFKINSILDIGTTEDENLGSSNFLIKKLFNKKKKFYSISDQKITNKFFKKKLKKSITTILNYKEIKNFRADLVVSNATIEHVGSFTNQSKMIKNILKLSKKIFVVTTPNRYHFVDFHTVLPFIHWLPKKIHRKILNMIGYKYLAKEKNLNLLSESDLTKIMNTLKFNNYKIFNIKFLFFKSNLILIGYMN
jgi:hypothetical protein